METVDLVVQVPRAVRTFLAGLAVEGHGETAEVVASTMVREGLVAMLRNGVETTRPIPAEILPPPDRPLTPPSKATPRADTTTRRTDRPRRSETKANSQDLSSVGVGPGIRMRLAEREIHSVDDLVKMTAAELSAVPYVSPKILATIQARLAVRNLKLADDK